MRGVADFEPEKSGAQAVFDTADGELHSALKKGTTYLARNVAVAAAIVSRAAKELHEDLSTPIDEVIEEAGSGH